MNSMYFLVVILCSLPFLLNKSAPAPLQGLEHVRHPPWLPVKSTLTETMGTRTSEPMLQWTLDVSGHTWTGTELLDNLAYLYDDVKVLLWVLKLDAKDTEENLKAWRSATSISTHDRSYQKIDMAKVVETLFSLQCFKTRSLPSRYKGLATQSKALMQEAASQIGVHFQTTTAGHSRVQPSPPKKLMLNLPFSVSIKVHWRLGPKKKERFQDINESILEVLRRAILHIYLITREKKLLEPKASKIVLHNNE